MGDPNMKVQLKNQHASATLYPSRGGLLTDLFLEDSRGEPVDIFWKAANILEEASGWPMGGMPFLFPFGGRVYHQDQPLRYGLADGREFHMPLHGFGYGVPWRRLESSAPQAPTVTDDQPRSGLGENSNPISLPPRQVTLVLEDSPTTHVLFPFRFRVALTYELEPSSLSVKGEIQFLGPLEESPSGSHADRVAQPQGENSSQTGAAMPVAPGFHPFFKIPLRHGGRFSECFLETQAETLLRVTPKGLAGKASAIEPSQRPHPLAERDFQNTILAGLKDPVVYLMDRDQKMSLEMGWSSQDPYKYLVLWTQPSEPVPAFFCVEPWTALPDALAPGHGAVWLQKGESLSFGLRICLRDQRR
jgi:galactose mutarotase-like enzyme